MHSNTPSIPAAGGLRALAAALEELAAQDPDGLAEAARAERALFGGPHTAPASSEAGS